MVRRHRFYTTPSWRSLVLLIFLGFVYSSSKYQVLYLYKITGRTTAEYTIRAFWKEAPYIEAVSRVSTAIWVITFVLIMLTYSSHLSFKLTYTPNIRRVLTGPSVKLCILAIAFMLNFL